MLEILSPGPLCTVQDRGRPGWGHLGVGSSGAADRHLRKQRCHGSGRGFDGSQIRLGFTRPIVGRGLRRCPVRTDAVARFDDGSSAGCRHGENRCRFDNPVRTATQWLARTHSASPARARIGDSEFDGATGAALMSTAVHVRQIRCMLPCCASHFLRRAPGIGMDFSSEGERSKPRPGRSVTLFT